MKSSWLLLLAASLVSERALAGPTERLTKEEVSSELDGLNATELAGARLYRAASESQRIAWREAIDKKQPGDGCYAATYPSAEWKPVECLEAPNFPMSVGNSYDYLVRGHEPAVSQVEGYFLTSGLSSSAESDNCYGDNHFTVQMNTNYFTSATCGNPVTYPDCQGWQQFIYLVSGASVNGSMYMQYWLLHYQAGGRSCLSGWTPDDGGDSCYKNSKMISLPHHSVNVLANNDMKMRGNANSGSEKITVTLDGTAYVHTASDSPLGLLSNWQDSEFNVFGHHHRSQAVFVSGVSLQPVVRSDSSTGNYPSCQLDGTTGETNNLQLSVGSCGTASSPYEYTFGESNPQPGAACPP